MICPYNLKAETTCQKWDQNSDENQILTDGKTTTRRVYEYMDCQKENCGAYYNGRCHYKD